MDVYLVIKGEMMKKGLIVTLLVVALCSLALCLTGCRQQGETLAEGHRRHIRNLSINNQQMMKDMDSVFLFDEPSRLTDKRIP